MPATKNGVKAAARIKLITSSSPESVELTVFEHGNAVVRETREITLHGGTTPVHIEGLPHHITWSSLTITPAAGSKKLKVVKRFTRPNELVLEPADGQTGTFKLMLMYEVWGIWWGSSRYEATPGDDESKLDGLVCYVDMDNRSGQTFDNASIKLVTGHSRHLSGDDAEVYPIEGKITLEHGTPVTLTLREFEGLAVDNEYFTSPPRFYWLPDHPNSRRKDAIWSSLVVRGKIDTSLPKGSVSSLELADDGELHKVECGKIHAHVYPKCKVCIAKRTEALTVQHLLLQYHEDPPGKANHRFAQATREIRLENNTDSPAEVLVHDIAGGDPEVLSRSHEFVTFNKSGRACYRVTVPERTSGPGQLTIRYQVKYRID